MAKAKTVKTKRSGFERDEKKSIVIALVVSAIVVLALVLAFVAIKRNHDKNPYTERIETESTEKATIIEGNSIVTNQEELNTALVDPDCRGILFETDNQETVVIPAGDFSGIDLIINAPYTEVTNYGVFQSITIQQIAANTWTESAGGNSIVVDSAACHIIIPSGVNVTSIKNIQGGSTLALENSGKISTLALEASDAITSVRVDGEISQIMVYAPTNLTLTGSTQNSTALELSNGSDGSTITSSIMLSINSYVSSVVEFQEGAQESVFHRGNESTETTITNNSAGEIIVVNSSGEEESLAAGQQTTYEAKISNGSSESQASGGTGNSGGSSGSTGSGGGSNSSGGSGSGGGSSSSGGSGSGGGSSSSGGSGSGGGSSSSGSTGTSAGSSGSSGIGGSTGSSGTSGTGGNTGSSGTSGTGGNTGGSGSSGTGDHTGSNGATPVDTYTKEQVDAMIAQAVAEATKGKLTQEEVDLLVAKAVQEAIDSAKEGMISKEEMEALVNKKVEEYFNQNIIVGLTNPEPVFAGIEGDLKNLEELSDMLPGSIGAVTLTGKEVFVKVSSWINEDHYDLDATSGIYRLTPVLELEEGYQMKGVTDACVKVFVGTEASKPEYLGEDFLFEDKDYESKLQMAVKYGVGENPDVYYEAKNLSEDTKELIHVDFRYYAFGEDGRLIPENMEVINGRYIASGKAWAFKRSDVFLSFQYAVVEVLSYSEQLEEESPVQYLENGPGSEPPAEEEDPTEGTPENKYVTVWMDTDGSIYIHNETEVLLSELSILMLYVDENGKICWRANMSTGTQSIPSINGMETDTHIEILDIPAELDIKKRLVYLSGGYVK